MPTTTPIRMGPAPCVAQSVLTEVAPVPAQVAMEPMPMAYGMTATMPRTMAAMLRMRMARLLKRVLLLLGRRRAYALAPVWHLTKYTANEDIPPTAILTGRLPMHKTPARSQSRSDPLADISPDAASRAPMWRTQHAIRLHFWKRAFGSAPLTARNTRCPVVGTNDVDSPTHSRGAGSRAPVRRNISPGGVASGAQRAGRRLF